MALPISISDLINRRVVESARVEYKADWNPEQILHSICAFANDIDNWGGGYIILWVPGGAERPYKCPTAFPTEKAAKADKAYYIRKMSNSIRANPMEEKELFMLASNQPYDDRPNFTAQIDDLKASLISEFLYTVGSDLHERSLSQPVTETAVSMRLLGGPSELKKPLNVGLMFFNERPDDFQDRTEPFQMRI